MDGLATRTRNTVSERHQQIQAARAEYDPRATLGEQECSRFSYAAAGACDGDDFVFQLDSLGRECLRRSLVNTRWKMRVPNSEALVIRCALNNRCSVGAFTDDAL